MENEKEQLEIKIELFGGKTAYLRKDSVDIDDGKFITTIMPSDLEDLLHAYKSNFFFLYKKPQKAY